MKPPIQNLKTKLESRTDQDVDRYEEHRYTSIQLVGVITPQTHLFSVGAKIEDFKLVTLAGQEYPFLIDERWREILQNNLWENVHVTGLLHLSRKALIPQKINPNRFVAPLGTSAPSPLERGRRLFKKVVQQAQDWTHPIPVLT